MKEATDKISFEKGDKIIYQYTHHLNSRSTTQIIKEGIYLRVVKRRGRNPYEFTPNRKVVVKLNGNKKESTVWESEIFHCKSRK